MATTYELTGSVAVAFGGIQYNTETGFGFTAGTASEEQLGLGAQANASGSISFPQNGTAVLESQAGASLRYGAEVSYQRIGLGMSGYVDPIAGVKGYDIRFLLGTLEVESDIKGWEPLPYTYEKDVIPLSKLSFHSLPADRDPAAAAEARLEYRQLYGDPVFGDYGDSAFN